MTELLLAAAAGIAVALLLGWALWARPLAGVRTDRDAARAEAAELTAEVGRQREERGRAAVEVKMLGERNAELRDAEAEREQLAGELRALKATQAASVQLSVPVIAAIGGIVFLGEAITLRLVLASVAILGGIALVIMEKQRTGGTQTSRSSG